MTDKIPTIKPKTGTSKIRVGKTKVPPKNIRNLGIWKMLENVDAKNKKTKKYGGKITYKMLGGQVVDSSYD